MVQRKHRTDKFNDYLFECMKLSTLTPRAAISEGQGAQKVESQCEKAHLLCLSDSEALMLFSLLQAALRHEESLQTLLSAGDLRKFHRTLSRALVNGLANTDHQKVKKSA